MDESTLAVLFCCFTSSYPEHWDVNLIILLCDTHVPCLRLYSYINLFVFPFVMYENMAMLFVTA
jgi:hypothetical protein